MTVDKSDIYRKAAEVIVRDGKAAGKFFENDIPLNDWEVERAEALAADRSLSVCAIGACIRAEYELTGHVQPKDHWMEYDFVAPGWSRVPGRLRHIWGINDSSTTTAEDVALLLKRKAEGEI